VKRFVRTLRGSQRPEAAGTILTAAGEEANKQSCSGRIARRDMQDDPEIGAALAYAAELTREGTVELPLEITV
jgi:hypothetical protein